MKWLVTVSLALAMARAGHAAESSAAITEQQGEWQNNYGIVYYRVWGDVQNRSKKPLRYVKLKLELLDAGGTPVYSMMGYNQNAEVLGGAEDEGGKAMTAGADALAKIEPIPPGGKDRFRLGASKEEMPTKPKWKTWRLTIVEAK